MPGFRDAVARRFDFRPFYEMQSECRRTQMKTRAFGERIGDSAARMRAVLTVNRLSLNESPNRSRLQLESRNWNAPPTEQDVAFADTTSTSES